MYKPLKFGYVSFENKDSDTLVMKSELYARFYWIFGFFFLAVFSGVTVLTWSTEDIISMGIPLLCLFSFTAPLIFYALSWHTLRIEIRLAEEMIKVEKRWLYRHLSYEVPFRAIRQIMVGTRFSWTPATNSLVKIKLASGQELKLTNHPLDYFQAWAVLRVIKRYFEYGRSKAIHFDSVTKPKTLVL